MEFKVIPEVSFTNPSTFFVRQFGSQRTIRPSANNTSSFHTPMDSRTFWSLALVLTPLAVVYFGMSQTGRKAEDAFAPSTSLRVLGLFLNNKCPTIQSRIASPFPDRTNCRIFGRKRADGKVFTKHFLNRSSKLLDLLGIRSFKTLLNPEDTVSPVAAVNLVAGLTILLIWKACIGNSIICLDTIVSIASASGGMGLAEKSVT